jgi:hypothetical protein
MRFVRLLASAWNSVRPATPTRRRRGRVVPRLEALDDRCLPSASTISGFVFNDANNNGLFDAGEVGLPGSKLQLLNAAGTVIGTATTDSTGLYQFATDSTLSTQPATLTHTVNFGGGATGWTQTQSLQQFDPSLGTLTSIDLVNAGTITSDIRVENLEATAMTVVGTVGGSVTLSGPGIMALTAQGSDNESFNAQAFDGSIDFAGPSGHDFGSKTATGQNTLTLSDPASLASFTGTGSVTLSEQGGATSQATGGGNLMAWITSTSSAQVTVVYHYTPSNALRPGNYTIVQLTDPTGFYKGKNTQGNSTPLPNSTGTHTIAVTLTTGGATNNDFGELAGASVSGSVWMDQNNNGQMDPGELPMAGVTVTLTGTDDLGHAVKLVQTTAADGSYNFAGLRPGTYGVTETQPTGYFNGKPSLGNLGGTIGANQYSGITLTAGAAGQHYDFAELAPSSLAGFVYLDRNNDGIKQATEHGIAKVLVTLTGQDDLGHAVTLTRRTAADGSYSFTGLRPGSYSIKIAKPANYLTGKNTVGSLGGSASKNLFSSIVLNAGSAGTDYDFGELPPAVPHAPPPPPSTTPGTNPGTLSKYNFLASTVWGW